MPYTRAFHNPDVALTFLARVWPSDANNILRRKKQTALILQVLHALVPYQLSPSGETAVEHSSHEIGRPEFSKAHLTQIHYCYYIRSALELA